MTDLRELGEQIRSTRPKVNSFRELLTAETLEKIKAVTDEPVYIILRYAFDDHPYTGGFTLPWGASLLKKEGLLEEYPYLKKYPHWEQLFDQIEETNCYLLGIGETDWLRKKNRQYDFKQRMTREDASVYH